MRKLHYLFLIILILLCTSFVWVIPEKNISITVSVDSVLCSVKQKIYLYYLDGNEFFVEDSAEISSQNKEVSLRGYIPYQMVVRLFFSQKGPNDVILIVSPHEQIKINITEADGGMRVYKKVIGSPATNEYSEFWKSWNDILMSIVELNALRYANSDSLELQRLIDDSIKVLNDKKKKITVQTLKHSVNPGIVWDGLLSLPSLGFSQDSIEKLQIEAQTRFPDYPKIHLLWKDTIYPKASKKSVKNMQIIASHKRNKRAQKNKEKYSRNINKENQPFISPVSGRTVLANFRLPNIEGDSISLSQFLGKYALVDFWASWCLSCVNELYVTKRISEKYRDKINICLISLDTNKTNWKDMIERFGLEALSNLSAVDEQNVVNKEIERLNMKTIPANYIIDPQGNIVAYDVFGTELINLLDSLILR